MSCVKSTLANHFIALISIFIIIDFLPTSKVIEVESMKSYSIFTATWWTEPSQMMCGKNNPISLHSVYTSAIGKREVSKICQNCWRIVLKNMGEGKGEGDKNPENCWGRLWMVSNANSHKIYYSFPATNNPIYITMYLHNSIK